MHSRTTQIQYSLEYYHTCIFIIIHLCRTIDNYNLFFVRLCMSSLVHGTSYVCAYMRERTHHSLWANFLLKASWDDCTMFSFVCVCVNCFGVKWKLLKNAIFYLSTHSMCQCMRYILRALENLIKKSFHFLLHILFCVRLCVRRISQSFSAVVVLLQFRFIFSTFQFSRPRSIFINSSFYFSSSLILFFHPAPFASQSSSPWCMYSAQTIIHVECTFFLANVINTIDSDLFFKWYHLLCSVLAFSTCNCSMCLRPYGFCWTHAHRGARHTKYNPASEIEMRQTKMWLMLVFLLLTNSI